MIEEVFENLVEQFSDPFTFYRELIQNAMDAGSNQVDVTIEYQSDREMVAIVVKDSGEGMNEAIISDQLTRFFSSTKEQDLTKIGKFGIGFASIFAIRPELVVIDTGRDGEFWRVAFDGTTAFKMLRLTEPVEGTTIKLFKPLAALELDHFIERSRETIAFWCRYSDTEVNFNGEAINLPLDVDSVCQAHHEQPGTTVVVGFTSESPAAFGMYNRGLTLKEGFQDNFPGITFRIKSHYLEHTLTRDNVLMDENYRKAMQIVERVIAENLMEQLFLRVEELLRDYPVRQLEFEELFEAAARVLSDWRKAFPKKFWNRPLFPQHVGPPLSIQEVRDKAFWEGAVYLDLQVTRVSHELHKLNVPVIWADPDGAVGRLVGAVTQKHPRSASKSVAAPVVSVNAWEAFRGSSEDEPDSLHNVTLDAWLTLCHHINELIRLGTNTIGAIALADFDYPGSAVAHLPCLAQPRRDEPIRLFGRGFWRSFQLARGTLLLNQRHPLIRKALRLAATQPALSAFVVTKAVLLNDGLPQDLEAKIVNRCWSLQ